MKRIFTISIALLVNCLPIQNLSAENIMMVRTTLEFPEAMTALQNAIVNQGYQLARVQHVDRGLRRAKYKTDKYRVVFFGKYKELKKITKIAPDLSPYLPLKISIFAENDQTLLVTLSPEMLKQFYPNRALHGYFNRWQKDIEAILNKVAHEK